MCARHSTVCLPLGMLKRGVEVQEGGREGVRKDREGGRTEKERSSPALSDIC